MFFIPISIEPLLESYKESTNGTFKPENDDHSGFIPPLPMTSLLPNKTKDGQDLPDKPKEEAEEKE